MYCIKCGKQIGDGRVVCEACEAAQSLPYDPQVDPLNQPQAAPEQPFVLNNPVEEAPKPGKKKKKFPVGAVVAAVLVVAIAVTAVFCWDAVFGFFVRSFGTPEDYMMHVEEKAMEEQLDELTSAYGELLASLNAGTETEYAAKAQLHLELGDMVIGAIETSMRYEGMDMDLSWLKNIDLSIYGDFTDDLTQSEVGIGLDGTTIATIRVLMDVVAGDMYIGIPELSDSYLYANMTDAGMNMGGMGIGDATAYEEELEELTELLPSEEKLNEVIKRWYKIVLDCAQDVEKDTETVEVDGLEQKLNVISYTLTEEDLLNIAIAVLEDVQDDEELMDLVIGVVDFVGSNTVSHYEDVWNDEWGMYEWVPVYEDIDAEEVVTEGIGDALDSLEDAIDDADEDNCIHMTTYVDNGDQIVGRHIEIEGTDMDTVEISYITVWQKDEFAFEAQIADTVEITGEGEREKDLLSGDYRLEVEGEEFLTLEITDYNEKLAEDGYLNGSFEIKPGEGLMDMVLGELGSAPDAMGSVMDIASLAIAVDVTSSESGAEYGLKIKMAGATVLGITVSGEKVEAGSVKAPKDTVDLYDQQALMNWILEMDFDQLIENLDDAGLPDELVDLIADAVGQIGAYEEPPVAYPDNY